MLKNFFETMRWFEFLKVLNSVFRNFNCVKEMYDSFMVGKPMEWNVYTKSCQLQPKVINDPKIPFKLFNKFI